MDKLPFADVNTLEILAKAGYKYKNVMSQEWFLVGNREIVSTGFYAKVFKCTERDEIVISFSGSDILNLLKSKADRDSSIQDIKNDLTLAKRKFPAQYENAKDLYRDVKKKYPKALISLTGDSLGGTLAALCGAETGERTYTFRAFGLATALPESDKKYDNVINIGETKDFVFMANANEHIGRTYVIPDENNNVYMPEIKSGLLFHLNDKASLRRAVEYKKGSVKTTMERIDDEENYDNFKYTIARKTLGQDVDVVQWAVNDAKRRITKSTSEMRQIVKDVAKETKRVIYQKRNELTDGHWVTIDHNHVFIKD